MRTVMSDTDPHHGVDGYKLLSLRNATYFMFAFGVTGVALTDDLGRHTRVVDGDPRIS